MSRRKIIGSILLHGLAAFLAGFLIAIACLTLFVSNEGFLAEEPTLSVSSINDKSLPSYDVKVCNRSSQKKVYVALAYYDQSQKKWYSKGWFTGMKNQCTTPLRQVSEPVFGYAESHDGTFAWQSLSDENQVELNQTFCIHKLNRFDFSKNDCQLSVMRKNIEVKDFKRLSLSGLGGLFTWDLVD